MKYIYYGLGVILITIGILLTTYYPIGGWELVSFMLGLMLFSKGREYSGNKES